MDELNLSRVKDEISRIKCDFSRRCTFDGQRRYERFAMNFHILNFDCEIAAEG